MAPPSNRRAGGFSRRAHLSLFAAYVLAILGVLVGLLLVIAARFDPPGFQRIRAAASDVTYPIAAAGRAIWRAGASVDDGVVAYLDAARQNRALREEVERARLKLVEARAMAFENRRLKQLLALRENAAEPVVVARLIGSTATGSQRYATLAAGWNAGVRIGQPVRAPEGLVGRVTEVGRFAARVLLLTDAGNVVPVRLARDGLPALATGLGDGRVELKALIAGNRDFRRGDIAITSGTGGLYPPNIPVAVVTRIEADGAIAWPIAHPHRLDFAIVERVYQPEPRLVAPPPPPAG